LPDHIEPEIFIFFCPGQVAPKQRWCLISGLHRKLEMERAEGTGGWFGNVHWLRLVAEQPGALRWIVRRSGVCLPSDSSQRLGYCCGKTFSPWFGSKLGGTGLGFNRFAWPPYRKRRGPQPELNLRGKTTRSFSPGSCCCKNGPSTRTLFQRQMATRQAAFRV